MNVHILRERERERREGVHIAEISVFLRLFAD
jgi:hypothetical protein